MVECALHICQETPNSDFVLHIAGSDTVFKIQTFNAISVTGLERFSRDQYEVASDIGSPDALILRSHKLSTDEIGPSVLAIGRAGNAGHRRGNQRRVQKQ